MKYITHFGLVIFSLLTVSVYGQSMLRFEQGKKKMSYKAYASFQEEVLSLMDAESSYSAIVSIRPSINNSKSNLIEGMESKRLATSSLKVKIYNNITKEDTTLIFESDVEAVSKNALQEAIVDKAFSKEQFKASIKEVVTRFQEGVHEGCTAYKNALEKQVSKNDNSKAYRMVAVLKSNDLCQEALGEIQAKIESDYNKIQCDNTIYKCKVLIANGDRVSLSKATRMLLNIPPTVECREEALEIVTLLDEKSNLKLKDRGSLKDYRKMLDSNDRDLWLNTYLSRN